MVLECLWSNDDQLEVELLGEDVVECAGGELDLGCRFLSDFDDLEMCRASSGSRVVIMCVSTS